MRLRGRCRNMLDWLQSHDKLTMEEAMRRFSVSEATARRDFAHLGRRGLVRRERGCLRPLDIHAGSEVPLDIRESQFEREKDAIMREAARLPRPRDALFVDVGSTMLHLAKYMPRFNLRVITNALRTAVALAERQAALPNMEIVLLGGNLYPHSYYTFGPSTNGQIRGYRAHWAFISPDGVGPDGYYEVNEFVAENQRSMIRNSDRTVLLASHNKFGKTSMIRVEPLDSRFIIVTDIHAANEPALQAMEKRGVQVVRAKVHP